MASLQKLSICGIRSFGCEAEDKQSISFEKPLTLILGDNGCGKSTIIECLRYITTQKEPSGKGVFIHDPNLTASATVKAFVKLKIEDIKGDTVHLSKSLQATRSRKGITTKNLDSTITRFDPIKGKSVSISSRCIDIIPEIMRMLGVSKAILENVIFCTQDDAHWPLDTDQKLKEKFDQIFDSEKYNKCLKKVRDSRKELGDKKKTSLVELKHLKERKDVAARKRDELKELRNGVKALEEDMMRLDASVAPVRERLKSVNEQEREFSKIYTTCETTKTELKGVEKAAEELKNKIRIANCEFMGTDEELEVALLDCDVQARNVNELNAELARHKRSEAIMGDEQGEAKGRMGQLTKTIEIHKHKQTEKEQKMRKLATECGMTSTHLSEDGLQRRIDAKKNDFNQLLVEHEKAEEAVQAKVEKARDDVKAKTYDVKRLNEALMENSREVREIKHEMENEEASQTRRERVSAELVLAEKALTEHQQRGNAVELTSQLNRYNTELQDSEEQLTALEESVRRLQEHAETGNRVALLRAEHKRKMTDMARLRNLHRETLIDVLESVPESGYKRAVERRAEQLSVTLRELRGKKAAKERDINNLKSSGKSLGDVLMKHKAEVESFTASVNELTGDRDLPDAVQKMEEKCNDLQDEKGALASSQFMYDRYIRALQRNNPCCPLCSRDFAAEEEARQLVEQLNYKKREVPNRLERVTNELQEAQNQLKLLLPLLAQNEKMTQLRDVEIPALARKQEDARIKANQAVNELDDVERLLTRAEKDREACTGMLADLALLDHLMDDLAKINLETEQLEKKLPAGWTADGLREEEERRNEVRALRKRKQSDRDQVQQKLNDYNAKLTQLQSRKHSLSEEEFKLRRSGGQRQQQEDRLVVLNGAEAALLDELQSARAAILPLEQISNQCVLELKQLKETHKLAAKEKQRELDGLYEQLKDIRRLQREIIEFERKGEQQELLDLADAIKQREEAIKAVKILIENTNAKLGEKSKSIVRRRELEDNKTMREKQREVERLETRLKELETKFGNMGYETLLKEKKRLRDEEEKIGQKKAQLGGQKGAIQGQMVALDKELETNMYRDIDTKYKKELCEMKVAEAIAGDLLRYASAMEFAMNSYHQQQMKRVNSIVREYWRKIYLGNDIDYIEVQADQVDTVSENRRNFNYKLVQLKNDVRLDMRGRCSAGQKMLASLIIRMALAEVFSANCGILTLDEPTTNLDRKNIRNLANTLNEIIEGKQRLTNTNFQLIVITHDKEFLNELITVNSVDKYVEVSRNRDGKSQLNVRTVVVRPS